MDKKVAIFSHDDSHTRGFYSKIQGVIDAARKMGLDYTWTDKEDAGSNYDVVINWDPFGGFCKAKKLTIVWVWDTYRIGKAGDLKNFDFDLLFRAHATHYGGSNLDPRIWPTYWMPPAVDPRVFKRNSEIKPEYDIVFIGTSRPFPEFEVFSKNFNVYFDYGRLSYEKYIETLNKGKLILNSPMAKETNKRVMEAMAIGPALMPWGPDYTLLATPNEDFVCYQSMVGVERGTPEWGPTFEKYEKYLVDLVRSYLDDPKALERIRKNGRHLINQQFTFKKQVERIEEIVRIHLR